MTAVTETAKKKTQVSTTLSVEAYDALEDYRWTNRINKVSDIVSEAVTFFLESKGIKVAAPAAEAPAEKPAK